MPKKRAPKTAPVQSPELKEEQRALTDHKTRLKMQNEQSYGTPLKNILEELKDDLSSFPPKEYRIFTEKPVRFPKGKTSVDYKIKQLIAEKVVATVAEIDAALTIVDKTFNEWVASGGEMPSSVTVLPPAPENYLELAYFSIREKQPHLQKKLSAMPHNQLLGALAYKDMLTGRSMSAHHAFNMLDLMQMEDYLDLLKGKEIADNVVRTLMAESKRTLVEKLKSDIKKSEETVAALQELAKHGEIFLTAGKRPRQDALSKVLEEIFKEWYSKNGRPPQYMDVVYRLRDLASKEHPTIQEIVQDEEEIIWRRESGKEEKTPFKKLRDRLTPIRKKYSRSTG